MAKDREESNSDPERLDELQLTRFLENRLDAAEQAEVQERLQRSSEDRRALDALREESFGGGLAQSTKNCFMSTASCVLRSFSEAGGEFQ